MWNFLPQHFESVASRPLHHSSQTIISSEVIMSAGASRRRTLMRPGAQHLSLSLVEHPSFKFRTYGAYASLATPATLALTPIDDDSGEDDDTVRFSSPAPKNATLLTSQAPPLSFNYGPRLKGAPRSALLSAPALPFACKSVPTPFTAMTVGSVYSQDSWGEPEFSGPGVDTDRDVADPDKDMGVGLPTSNADSRPLRSVGRVRVDTRRFGMAFSPNTSFMLPLASASFPSPANRTFVLNLQSVVTEDAEEPQSQPPSPSLDEHVPHATPKVVSEIPFGPAASQPTRQNDKIAEVAPRLPVVTAEVQHDPPVAAVKAPRRAKSARFTINRTSSASASLRSSAKGLTRLLSCVALPTHLSRRTSGNHKRQTAKHPYSKKQTAHPVPAVPDLLGDESLIVFDLKTSSVDAMQMEAPDCSIPGSGALTSPQTAIFSTTGPSEHISQHTHARLHLSSMHLETVESYATLPAIAISPLEVTFGGCNLP